MSIALDIVTANAANLHMSDNGQWIVWQEDPGVCLGIGATEDEARADAIKCGVGADHINDDDLEIDILEIVQEDDPTDWAGSELDGIEEEIKRGLSEAIEASG